jgi:hypothetical protein
VFNAQMGGDAPTESTVTPVTDTGTTTDYSHPQQDPANAPGVPPGPYPGLGGNNQGNFGGYGTEPPSDGGQDPGYNPFNGDYYE